MEESNQEAVISLVCSVCGERVSKYYSKHLEDCHKKVKAKGLTDSVVCDGCHQTMDIIDYPLHRTIEITSVEKYSYIYSSEARYCRQCTCAFSNSQLLAQHWDVYHSEKVRVDVNLNFTCSICHKLAGNFYNDHLEKCYTNVISTSRTDSVICDGCNEEFKVTVYPLHRLFELTNNKNFRGTRRCKICGCKFHSAIALIKHNNVFHTEINGSAESTTQKNQRPIREPLGNALQDGQTTTKKKTLKRNKQPEELTQQQIEDDFQQSTSQSKRSLTSPSLFSFPSNSSTPSSVEPLQSAALSQSTVHDEISRELPSHSLITPPHLNNGTQFCGFCGLKMPLQQWDHVARCHVKHVTKGIETCSEMLDCSICKEKVNYKDFALHFHQEFCKVRNEECPLKCDKCECTFKETLTLSLHRLLHRTMQ